MLKQMISAAVALIAATAWAHAAEGARTGRITFIDAPSRTVLIDNARVDLAATASLSSLNLGAQVATVSGPAAGAYVVAAAAISPMPAPAAAAKQTATGHITYIDRKHGTMLIDSVRWEMRTAIDVSRFHIGSEIQVGYYAASGGRKVVQSIVTTPAPTRLAAVTAPATVVVAARAQ